MKPVLIVGAGQIAQVFQEYLSDQGYRTAAYVVDAEFAPTQTLNRPVVAMEDVIRLRQPDEYCFIVGMSFRGLNIFRKAKFEAMLAMGYEPLTFVDRRASVSSSAQIGHGSFIMEGNIVQSGVEVGANTIVWGANWLGHHSKIGDHCWISSHAVISGAVEIGDRSFVGVGVSMADGIKVGRECILGIGSVLSKNCEDGGVYQQPGAERSSVPSNRMRGVWAGR